MGRAHDAEADETDVAHLSCSEFRKRAIKRLPGLAVCGSIGRKPAQARRGRGVAGLYSQPIQPRVAELVDAAEQERVVDLAGSRLVAARIVGELDVADAVELGLDACGPDRPPSPAHGRCRTAA